MFDPQILAFTGVAALLTITPGADTMLVMRTVLTRSQQAGVLTTLGICTGLLVHALLSALGLSIILMRSAEAFEVVKWVGACYLIFLGIQSLVNVVRNRHTDTGSDVQRDVAAGHKQRARSYLEGLLTNILNPKVALFYLAFLPQFIQPTDPVLAKSVFLALIHLVLSLIWLLMLTALVGRIRTFVTNPKVRQWLEAATGVILIGLGVRLALERR